MGKAAMVDPETLLKWAALGSRLIAIGATTAEQFSWIIKLVHGPLPESEVQAILKKIEEKALADADAADKDAAPIQREGEGL